MTVAYPPGGATDLVARALAERMTQLIGQSVITDNKSGASGMVGTDAVAKSLPDGYTLLFAPSAFSIVPILFAKLPYNSIADFSPVGLVGKGAQVISV